MRKMRTSVLSLVLVSVALLVTGCEEKKIREIRADPARYSNREVGVVGQVVNSYSILGHGAYEVDDGTGRLWVISEKGVPRKGSRVAVRGTIRDAFNLGSAVKLPDEVRSGMVMIEAEHKAR